MKVTMRHHAGDFIQGQTYDLPERKARGLIQTGYAVAGADDVSKPEQAMEQTDASTAGRPAKGAKAREVRG